MTCDDPPARGPELKSFVVRLWRGPEGICAEARPLAGGGNRSFEGLEALVAHLAAEAVPEGGSADRNRPQPNAHASEEEPP